VKPEAKSSVVVAIDPTLYVAGNNTFLNELVTLAGATNVFSDVEGWPQVSEETLIKKDPAIYLFTYGYYVPDAAAQVKANKKYANAAFVKNDQIIGLDADQTNRPGPRLADALVDLTQKLYPEFK
ncbi:MAG: ABC transporter substrate-binding protein, partial [Bacilli bacterium]